MDNFLYTLNVWLHVLMATIWVGGLVYTAAVVVPFAVSHSADERQRILRGLARRFRMIGWGTVAILVITGLANLYWTNWFKVPDRAAWLHSKLLFVVLMIGLMVFHDIASARAARKHEGARDSAPGNRAGSIAAAIATLLAVAILYVSVRLVRG